MNIYSSFIVMYFLFRIHTPGFIRKKNKLSTLLKKSLQQYSSFTSINLLNYLQTKLFNRLKFHGLDSLCILNIVD